MKMKIKIIWFLVLPFFLSCSKEDPEVYTNIPIDYKIPSNFPPLVFNLKNNPLTNQGFELGKKLFYDGRLASDGIVSCAFCHLQENAFSHHKEAFSQGVNGSIGTRNTPALQNLAFQTTFMYDGAASHLDLQPIIPFTNPIEMDGNFLNAIKMMKEDKVYQKLFNEAFKEGEINTENMLKALGQFMVMLTSSNSRFDKYRRKEVGGTMSKEELAGYDLFNDKCASCHATDLMSDGSFRNNGLAVDLKINDIGRYRVTELKSDYYKFKVPSLRNVEKTAPYMHDGRFNSLEKVLDHYNSGVVDSKNLDPILKQNNRLGISVSYEEKIKLIAFLKTLTDYQFLNDKRFSKN
jgi:cytochrome c peroxidase